MNEQIHAGHVLCAAHEGPLEPADAEWFGAGLELTAERLEAAGELRRRPGGTFVPRHAGEYPASAVSLRSTGRDGFSIVDVGSGELLGTVDAGRAFNTTHEGAVYLHGGRAFEVTQLDLELRRAFVEPFEGDWYTQAKRETDMYIERLDDRREWLGVRLSFGTVVVTEQVVAYQTRRLSDHEVLDLVGARPAADVVLDPGAVVRAARGDRVRRPAARPAARRAARGRAHADRRAPAAGDVRPLGHRRALDQPAPADRRADDLHLRRPSRAGSGSRAAASSRSTRWSTTRTG